MVEAPGCHERQRDAAKDQEGGSGRPPRARSATTRATTTSVRCRRRSVSVALCRSLAPSKRSTPASCNGLPGLVLDQLDRIAGVVADEREILGRRDAHLEGHLHALGFQFRKNSCQIL